MGKIGRRRFISRCLSGVAGVATATLGGVVACSRGGEKASLPRKVSLARLSELSGKRTFFRLERVLLHHDERGLAAMSLTCTHETCGVAPKGNGFQCTCHDARFDAQGRVLSGPAEEPLPWYKLSIEGEQLFVHLDEIVPSSWRLTLVRQ